MNEELRQQLKLAYAKQVDLREAKETEPWRFAERQIFLDELKRAGAKSLLEIGAGVGRDAIFFAGHGIQVLATDLTEENVAHCRAKEIRAEIMDACNLQVPAESFDAAYSLNGLVHIPRAEFPIALANIHTVLKLGGLFYMSLLGGPDREGIFQDDFAEPKRFFSHWSDDALRTQTVQFFEILRFHTIEFENASTIHLQSLILKKLSKSVP